MKKRSFSKKLSLNKETVSILNASALNQLKGGAASVPDDNKTAYCLSKKVTYCVTCCNTNGPVLY